MMRSMKLLCLSLITFVIGDVTANIDIWTKVMVGTDYIEADENSQIIKTNSTVVCGTKCSMESFCRSWCIEKRGECILGTIVVSPYYVDSSPNSTTCYTKRRRDLAVVATTSSTQVYGDSKSELLADGIFLSGFGNVFAARPGNPSFVLFDLKKPAIISEIRLMMDIYYCTKIKVLIGNSTNAYTRIHSILYPCGDVTNIRFKPLTPIQGQYVLVARTSSQASLAIYHTEIDGEFLPGK